MRQGKGMVMIKRREISDPNSYLNRSADGEVLFVLMGRDAAAPATIQFWISQRVLLGKNAPDDAQLLEAKECAKKMARQSGTLAKEAPAACCISYASHVAIPLTSQSFDCRDWARLFVEMVSRDPSIASNQDAMRTWFSAALMRGYDEARRQDPKETPR